MRSRGYKQIFGEPLTVRRFLGNGEEKKKTKRVGQALEIFRENNYRKPSIDVVALRLLKWRSQSTLANSMGRARKGTGEEGFKKN